MQPVPVEVKVYLTLVDPLATDVIVLLAEPDACGAATLAIAAFVLLQVPPEIEG